MQFNHLSEEGYKLLRKASYFRGAQRAKQVRTFPPFIFMTDTARGPDPSWALSVLPRGSGVIFRHYEHPERAKLAQELRTIAAARGLIFLIAGDALLARQTRADGLHLPEWQIWQRPDANWQRDWIVTAAVHSPAAIKRADEMRCDAGLLSPVFATCSHPGSRPLTQNQRNNWTKDASLPLFALGGISGTTIKALRRQSWAGVATVSGLKPRTY